MALASRAALLLTILMAGGLLAATLVRMAPGFGMDERMLDARLNSSSRKAIEQQLSEGSDIVTYYGRYLQRLWRGDLGNSISLGRPVSELLSERCGVSLRSGLAGIGLAWAAALLAVVWLELARARTCEAVASLAAGALLCVPAAVVALGCLYLGGTPSLAVAAILFSRIFRYVRNIVRAACQAPHVLAAKALGIRRFRLLTFHVMAPVLPEMLALAGVSVSMAVGALIPVEALCDSPGVGQLAWQAALARDLPVLVNVTLIITGLTAVANLMADTLRVAREAWA
jgi:peptide/nickel transport system permease protein